MSTIQQKFGSGLSLFFLVVLAIDVAFGVWEWRTYHDNVRMIAPVVIGAFIVGFYIFARSGNDLGPR